QNLGKPLSAPPKRPSLPKPPPRPEATPPPAIKSQPAAPAPETTSTPAAASELSAQSVDTTPPVSKVTNHPIAPPSEPMQYRAIGLVRGVYQPEEEQLNRGNIVTEDGTYIDAVLLGRVTSLIKKHIDLEAAHLWVVYPRTRQPAEDAEESAEDSSLHLQIVGIWEPDTLGLPGENPKTITDESEADETASAAADDESAATSAATTPEAEAPAENYFSIRGEVLGYEEDTETILVKIVQASKRSSASKTPKAFKLHIFGAISGKTLGYFWEFDVERQGEKLMMTDGHPIRMVPPKKKKRGRSPYPRRSRQGDGGDRPRPTRHPDKPRIKPPAPVKSNPL
ncbi:MAG: hypothetical protein AAF283_10705, partial [Cyanobacteria bacterium P01_A01_bin.70]